jgi:hypothetical protein
MSLYDEQMGTNSHEGMAPVTDRLGLGETAVANSRTHFVSQWWNFGLISAEGHAGEGLNKIIIGIILLIIKQSLSSNRPTAGA